MKSETLPAGQERFLALDGLRALAITVVVLHHTRLGGSFLDRGLGVGTLFVISGFLVTWLLLREHERTGTIRPLQLHVRRAFRILPLYYVMLVLYICVTAALEPRTSAGLEFWANLPKFATLTASNITRHGDDRIIFLFAWSVSTQERLYLVWPWIIRLVKGRIPLVLAICGILSVLPTPFFPPFQTTPIWLGAALACLVRHPRGAALLQTVAGGWWSVPVALAAVLAPIALPSIPELFTVGALAYLVAVCVVRPGILTPVLVNPVAKHVGKVSFGIYLMHMLCLRTVRLVAPNAWPVAIFAVGLVLCVVVATLSERFFESPVRQLGIRLFASKHPKVPPQKPTKTGELEPALQPAAAAVQAG